jgi:hypothetical protein
MLSNSGELHNFLDTCRKDTPLRGCNALSMCTNVSGLCSTGWSVKCSMRGSVITFTEILIGTNDGAVLICGVRIRGDSVAIGRS